MSRYRYSGNNLFGNQIPKTLQCDDIVVPPANEIFPCRVYDAKGKLKCVVTRQEILKRGYQKQKRYKGWGND